MIESINPYNGQLLKSYSPLSSEELEAKLNASTKAYSSLREISVEQRANEVLNLASLLKEKREQAAALISAEMGKVYKESLAEIDKCVCLCEYYAGIAEQTLKPKVLDLGTSQLRYDPLGIVLGVMPWNFPFWQVFRFAVPTYLAGNAILLKHASNVPQCALLIEKLFQEAVELKDAFQTLLIPAKMVEKVIANDKVQGVSLTGSEFAGTQVASLAGENIKPSLLELGGTDPFIVFGDAEVNTLIDEAFTARFLNAGQSCIAAKRFIVHESVYDEFISLLKNNVGTAVVGNPMDELSELGPMAREDLAIELEEQVNAAIMSGAILEGGKLRRQGALFSPVILSNVKKDNPAYGQELFGPVAMVFSFSTKEEAVRLANDVPYGLGSSVWTSNKEVQEYCVRNLEYGAVFLNKMVASDPRLPFGGVKKSGYGRELAEEGLLSFVNAKTVYKA